MNNFDFCDLGNFEFNQSRIQINLTLLREKHNNNKLFDGLRALKEALDLKSNSQRNGILLPKFEAEGQKIFKIF